MKKLTVCSVVLASCTVLSAMQGCVDRNYDLRNMDSNEITVGNVITTPPISVRLPFEGIAGGLEAIDQILADNGLSREDIGLVPMDIDAHYNVNMQLESPLVTGDILEYFNTDEGTASLLVDIESTLRMEFDLQLAFCGFDGEPIVSFDNISIAAATGDTPSVQSLRLDVSDVLARLDQIFQINVSIDRLDMKQIVFDLDDTLLMNVRLEKTGGIKLYSDEK